MGSFVNEEDDNVTYLANFIKSIEPLFEDNESFDGLEEALLNLEMTDGNFHRHDFVRRIRERISFEMGDSIDEIAAKDRRLLHDEKLITTVVSQLLKKDSYKTLVSDALNGLSISSKTVKKDIENGELQFSPLASVRTGNQFIYGPRSIGDDSFTSSFDAGATFMFMSVEKYDVIAAKLCSIDHLSGRMEALSALNQIPQADIVSSEAWPRIKQGLDMALSDNNDAVVLAALQFYGRAVTTTSAVVAKELYVSFVENLIDSFSDNTNHMIVLQNGIDFGDKRNTKYVRMFVLLNQFQRELPVCWIRYAEKVVESIVDCTVKLLGLVLQPLSPMEDVLLPLQFLALVDPEAIWFKKWMHGHYSRSILLSLLEKHHNLVTSAILTCFECLTTFCYADAKIRTNASHNEDLLIHTKDEITTANILHSFNFLGHLFSYKSGRALFPLQLEEPNGVVTLDDVVVALIQIACSIQRTEHSALLSINTLPVKHAVLIVIRLATDSEATCYNCLCTPIVIASMQTLLTQLQSEIITEDNAVTLKLIANILTSVSQFVSGRLQLLYVDPSHRWQRNPNSFASIILQFLCRSMKLADTNSIMANVVTSFLSVCHQLYNTCEGLYCILLYELPNVISEALNKLSQKLMGHLKGASKRIDLVDEIILPYINENENIAAVNSKLNNVIKDYGSFEEDLKIYLSWLDSLLHFSATPKGVLLFQLSGMADVCIRYMSAKHKLYHQISRSEKHGYEMVINQLAVTPSGAVALNKTGTFQSILEEVWLLLDGNAIHQHALNFETVSDDLSCKSSRRLMVAMVSYFGCFDAMAEYFETEVKIITNASSQFSSLSDFIGQCVTMDTSNSEVGAAQFELRHAFALTIINALISCLDTMLYLQERFKITESIVKLQSMYRLDSGSFIIDACTLLRNEFLVRSSVIGGPDERIIPPSSLSQDESGYYPWPLFAGFPIPSVYACVRHSKESLVSHSISLENGMSEELLSYLTKGGQLTTALAADLLNKCEFSSPEIALRLPPIRSAEIGKESKGMKNEIVSNALSMVVSYGLRLGLLKPSQQAQEGNLSRFLTTVKVSLEKQQINASDTDICYHRNSTSAFDWFACVVYLIEMGDADKALQYLQRISGHVVSAYLWMPRLHNSTLIKNASLRWCGVSLLHSKIIHNIELILQTDMPEMVSAFKLSSSSPSQITALWLRQCFMNYLNWKQIEIYIVLCSVCGLDYQIYCSLAVLKHLKRDILEHAQKRDLLMFLRQEPIVGFSFQNYISFMREMQYKYRDIVLEDMTDLSRA